jgi:hypothetical protein
LIKNYLIKNTNALFFSTTLGAIDEINKKLLVYKKVENKTLINNKIGILIKKNKVINSKTNEFLQKMINEFKKF